MNGRSTRPFLRRNFLGDLRLALGRECRAEFASQFVVGLEFVVEAVEVFDLGIFVVDGHHDEFIFNLLLVFPLGWCGEDEGIEIHFFCNFFLLKFQFFV